MKLLRNLILNLHLFLKVTQKLLIINIENYTNTFKKSFNIASLNIKHFNLYSNSSYTATQELKINRKWL